MVTESNFLCVVEFPRELPRVSTCEANLRAIREKDVAAFSSSFPQFIAIIKLIIINNELIIINHFSIIKLIIINNIII